MSDSDSEEKPKESTSSDRKLTQNDLLATRRSDVLDEEDGEDDENAENGTVDWMRHKLKFVKHFEDSLRDGSFEPGADMYVTNDPLERSPVRERAEGVTCRMESSR